MLAPADKLSALSLLMCLAFTLVLAVARLVARGLRGRTGVSRYRLLGAAACVALVLAPALQSSGNALATRQVLLLAVLWIWSATELALRDGNHRVAFWGLYTGSCAISLAWVVWRGLFDGGSISADYHFVFPVIANGLWYPAADQLFAGVADDVFWRNLWELLDLLLLNIVDHFPFAISTANFGLAWFALHALDLDHRHRPGPSPWAPPGALVFLLPLAWLAGEWIPYTPRTSAVHFIFPVLAAPFWVAGLVTLHRLLERMRTRRLMVGIACVVTAFVPAAGTALVLLGWLARLLPRVTSRAARPGRIGDSVAAHPFRALLGGGLVAVALMKMLVLPEYRMLEATTPVLRDGPALCTDVHATIRSGAGMVAYSGAVIEPFEIAIHESSRDGRPVAVTSHEMATAVCEEAGARLCTPNEWYIACACGHADLLRPEHMTLPYSENSALRGPWQVPDLTFDLIEWATDENGHFRADAISQHGVVGLIGGSAEVLEGPLPGGGIRFAGATTALNEDQMSDCRFRGRLARSAAERHQFPYLGVRCCRSEPDGER